MVTCARCASRENGNEFIDITGAGGRERISPGGRGFGEVCDRNRGADCLRRSGSVSGGRGGVVVRAGQIASDVTTNCASNSAGDRTDKAMMLSELVQKNE